MDSEITKYEDTCNFCGTNGDYSKPCMKCGAPAVVDARVMKPAGKVTHFAHNLDSLEALARAADARGDENLTVDCHELLSLLTAHRALLARVELTQSLERVVAAARIWRRYEPDPNYGATSPWAKLLRAIDAVLAAERDAKESPP